jgi:hypothetical protein
MISTDFIGDDTNDLLIQDGDFVVGPSETQHISDMLLAAPGAYKQSPLLGINIYNELNGDSGQVNMNAIRKRIQLNAQMDGMVINSLMLNGLNDFTIDVSR